MVHITETLKTIKNKKRKMDFWQSYVRIIEMPEKIDLLPDILLFVLKHDKRSQSTPGLGTLWEWITDSS